MMAAVVLAVGVASCGEPAARDVATLQESLAAAVLPDHPGLVTGVSCPSPIPVEVTSLTCTAAVSGEPISMLVTIDADGIGSVVVDAVLVDVVELAESAATRLDSDLGVPNRVVCAGQPVVVSIADTVLTCTATSVDGAAHPITVTIADDNGSWSLELGSG